MTFTWGELSLGKLSELRLGSPSTAVVSLTMEDDPAFVRRKLGLSGRPELVRYALERGVIHR